MGTKQFNDKTTHRQQLRQGSYGNGKTEAQDFSRTIPGLFHFSRTQFFPQFCITQRLKVHFFQPEAAKRIGALDFFDSDTGDKNRDYCTN